MNKITTKARKKQNTKKLSNYYCVYKTIEYKINSFLFAAGSREYLIMPAVCSSAGNFLAFKISPAPLNRRLFERGVLVVINTFHMND
jgi:hypothetical protein